ncbi:acetyl-CoA carboxylase biotin carboxyl carrier protein subunit, partial [Anaerotruncus sp. AF02-27]
MKRFNITVNGRAYDVQVDELAAGAPAPVAAPAPAP